MPTIKNVKYCIIQTGSGDKVVTEQNTCRATLIMQLNKGELISTRADIEIAYSDRSMIAGIRYGILGMHCGEVRELRVPPHLAYGDTGLTGQIPPNSVLKIQIKVNQIK